MRDLTDEEIKEFLATIENKPRAITDPERLKIKAAPDELTHGGATLSIWFDRQRDPELLVSFEIANDPARLQLAMEWGRAYLAGDKDKCRELEERFHGKDCLPATGEQAHSGQLPQV